MRIGAIEVTQVIDATATIDPVAVWGPAAIAAGGKGATLEEWAAHPALTRPDGLLDMPVGAFLVRHGDRVVLIDLGYGPTPPAAMDGGRLLVSLAAVGLRPEDITDVVFSHLHPDHVGWAGDGSTPTFGRATYHCHADDWQYFVEDASVPAVSTLLSPLADRMEVWQGSCAVIAGIDLVAAPGHTPGNAYIVLSSGEARAFLLGDIVHCPVELVDDDWAGLGDVDPVLAKQVRAALAQELEGATAEVAGAHFPGMQFGRLLAGQGSRSWRWS
jgi:glyoxylase-like metal-dependent hydrolase (beta-lactamase superfamily II)